MSLLSPTCPVDELPPPAGRMPTPRSVWGVGLVMTGLIVALVEGLAQSVPDRRAVDDLRLVFADRDAGALAQAQPPVMLPPGQGALFAPTLPETAAAPWSAAGLPPAPQALPVATCGDCGVVEAVRPVSARSEGDRPAVRSQAASATPKPRRASAYRVSVRMDDGSVRTLTQRRPPVIGARVVVAGHTLRPAQQAAGA